MSRCSWPLFFAGFCIFAYTLSVVYVFTGLSGLHNLGEENEKSSKEVDPDTKNETDDLIEFSRATVAAYAFTFAVDIGMLICSVLLYIGVKKENYKFVMPWLGMFLFEVFAYGLTYSFEEDTDMEEYYRVATKILITIFWYPIYNYYKKLRYPKTTETEQKCHPDVSAHPHTTEFVHSAQGHVTYCPATAPTEEC